MRYLLGLVMKSAAVAPPRGAASYALDERPEDTPALAEPARASAPPVTNASTALARSEQRSRDEANAHDTRTNSSQRRDAGEHRSFEPPAAHAASVPMADATHIGAPHVDTPQRRDEPAPERTHERVVERTHERVEHVERVERIEHADRATTVLLPAAQVAAVATPVVSAAARRAVPSSPPVVPAAARTAHAPDVTIAIGTIELRGAGATAAAPARAHRPRLTLDDYLASRNAAR
jgi:hypothetical protein